MTVDFAEGHDELRAVARALLAKASPAGASWQLFADAGWLGLEVPEDCGGAGAGFAEVAVLLEEMGRAGTPAPYLGTVVLGVGALDLLEPSAGRDELLGQVASGAARVAVALGGEDSLAGGPPFRVERSAGGLRLHGRAEFVPGAAEADHLLLLAFDAVGGPVLVHVGPDGPRPDVTDQPVLDATRRFGVVEADGIALGESSVWRFGADAAVSARRLLDRGAVAVACDSLGLARAMLDATVAYVGVRQQFGRPIGSFQAVKHACADMLVDTSVSGELLAPAVRAVGGDGPDDAVAVSRAKSYVCSVAVDVVGKALQMHGGIGYTWESGIHVHLKRAALNRSLFGSPRAHRARLAERFAVAETEAEGRFCSGM